MNPYASLSDDFYLYCYLNTELDLPNARDTVLHFFEQFAKAFPSMTNFYARENHEFMLEEDKEPGAYRWLTLEPRRLSSGYLNPPDLDDCHPQHQLMLDLAPHLLSVSPLDCEALDVMFGFDFNYKGNHDEVVGEAFGMDGRFSSLIRMGNARLVNFEPNLTLALDEQCRLQARLSIVTRTNSYQVRTSQYNEDAISVYLTIRQYWNMSLETSLLKSYSRQVEIGQDLVDNHIIPNIVVPLSEVISTR